MKIFTAGLETETNTFSPIPTKLEDYHITRREDMDNQMALLATLPPFTQWMEKADAIGAEFIFSIYGWAQPAGPTEQSAYETLRDKILSDLKSAGKVDIVLLFLHGAMIATDCDDCEADLMSHIRNITGSRTVIAAELDLHAQLSSAMLDAADILIAYKEYPHIDVAARGEELFDLAVKTSRGEIKPTMAFVDCNLTGMFPTTTSPMREFVDAMSKAESLPGVLSLSLIHSFVYGDVVSAGTKMLAITDTDSQLAVQVATDFSSRLYALREAIAVKALSMDKALDTALKMAETTTKPIVVADQSDNAGGGAPADATFALQWLLDRNISGVAIATFYGPDIVKQAITTGVGHRFTGALGGRFGAVSGEPVIADFKVIAIQKNYQHQFPQHGSDPILMPLGDTVSLRYNGIVLVVSSVRCQCFCPSIFTDLDIAIDKQDLLIAKSTQHFYNAFKPIASQVIYMSAPGAVPPNVNNIHYQKMTTHNKYPWISDPRASEALVIYNKRGIPMMEIKSISMRPPYLLIIGDVSRHDFAKTALGLVQWCPDQVAGQMRFDDNSLDLGVPEMTLEQAVEAGVNSVVIGVAPVGGQLTERWKTLLVQAAGLGLDVVSGLHMRLADIDHLRETTKKTNVQLIDIRVPPTNIPVGNGIKRSGLRVLMVGTDCAVGKKYTALALTESLRSRNSKATFRATGQTGIMIAGKGIPIDAVVSDFVSGAAELISPDNDPSHWDVIEGQGSLFNPSYAGVSLGLLHGSQPDYIVACHDARREFIISCPQLPLPSLSDCIDLNIRCGQLTNPHIRCAGISVNTSALDDSERKPYLDKLSRETGYVCVDSMIDGCGAIAEQLLLMRSAESAE